MTVDFKAPVGIKNRFTIHVDDIVTGAHREYKAENIVLNAMYTRLVNFQSFFVNIHFGTGTGLFTDATRTSLFTHLGTQAATTEFQTRALPTSQWRRKIVLAPEAFVGATITEVGVAFGSTSSNLVTHAAIKDAEGNPISLGPKTATQVITIYADIYFQLGAFDAMYGGKIRWVQPLANNELLSYLMGASYPTQQFRVTGFGFFGDGTALSSHGASANVGWTADAANKKRTTSVMRLGIGTGNGEIRGFGLGSSDVLGTLRGQFPITGVFTGKAITGENLGSGDGAKTGFNLAWNDPASLVVKSDGVPVSALDYDALPRKNLFKFSEIQAVAGSTDDMYNLVDNRDSTNKHFSATFIAGIDVGAAMASVNVNTFRIRSHTDGAASTYRLSGSNNADFSGKVTIADVSFSGAGTWGQVVFTPVAYRYYTVERISGMYMISQIQLLTADDQITFDTPPALGAVITADYTVDYVPKDSNHVLDLQATIQYGEIV